MNKLWSQTMSKAKVIDIWESFHEDPETYKVRKSKLIYELFFLKKMYYLNNEITFRKI